MTLTVGEATPRKKEKKKSNKSTLLCTSSFKRNEMIRSFYYCSDKTNSTHVQIFLSLVTLMTWHCTLGSWLVPIASERQVCSSLGRVELCGGLTVASGTLSCSMCHRATPLSVLKAHILFFHESAVGLVI